MSRCQLIVTSCVWKNYCGSPWGHTICYSVHKSAVSEVMQCWWLCCRADGRREVGDSFWTSGWLVRARSEQLPKSAHRRFQDQSSRFSRRWAGSNFLDRIVRGLCIHILLNFGLQYRTTLSVIKPYKIGQIVEHKHKRVESESEKIDAIVRLNARTCFVLSCFVLFTHSSCPSPIPFTPRQVHRATPWPPPLEWMWGPLSTASRGSWPPSLLTIITHTPALKHSPHHHHHHQGGREEPHILAGNPPGAVSKQLTLELGGDAAARPRRWPTRGRATWDGMRGRHIVWV